MTGRINPIDSPSMPGAKSSAQANDSHAISPIGADLRVLGWGAYM
jgi:hypothetical protein